MGKAFRSALTGYLCRVPLGTWPEYCVQDYAGRRQLLSKRSMSELCNQFRRTHYWYLRYAFQFLTAPLRKKPTFFLMGFPKCGTTYLADRLSALKDVGNPTALAPISKETLHYRNDQAAHAFMPIRGFYPVFSSAKHFFDASVSYSLDTGSMKRVKKDVPDAKVILVVRDQIGRFESGINYYDVRLWRKGPEKLKHFDDPDLYRRIPMKKLYAAIEYTDRQGCSIVATMKSREILEMFGEDALIGARFTPMLYNHWVQFNLDIFGRDNVMVIDFADLITEPVSVMASVASFLGLQAPGEEQCTEKGKFNKHVSKKVFRLNSESKEAIRDVFYPHNAQLHEMCGVDLNQHLDRHCA